VLLSFHNGGKTLKVFLTDREEEQS
jgi:hypothetical protein